MENNFAEEILNKLSSLPHKAQFAFSWMIENIKALTVLLDGKTPENIDEDLKTAWKSENYYLYVLLLIKKFEDKSLNN